MLTVDTNKQNTYGNDNPKCPHCGWEYEDTFELSGDDGDELELECGDCEKKFTASVSVSRTFTTNCIESEHEMVTDGEYKSVAGKQCRYLQCRNCEYTGHHSDEEAKKFKKVEVVETFDL